MLSVFLGRSSAMLLVTVVRSESVHSYWKLF